MKICVSGPVVSGKTYFIQNLNYPFLSAYPEAARKVNDLRPDLVIDNYDLTAFRKKVCDFQVNIESLGLDTDDTIHIFDRGIIDNLTFLALQEDKNFASELSRAIRLYDSGIIKPYDYIFYFDISPFDVITPLLKTALNDPLRKATIDINNFRQHIVDFRNTFIDIVNFLNLSKKVIVQTAYLDEEGYDKRNEAVKDFILRIYTKGGYVYENDNS